MGRLDSYVVRTGGIEAEPSVIPALRELVTEYNRGLLTQNGFRERIVDLWQSGRITDGQFCEYDRMQADAYLPQSHFEEYDHFEFIYSEDKWIHWPLLTKVIKPNGELFVRR